MAAAAAAATTTTTTTTTSSSSSTATTSDQNATVELAPPSSTSENGSHSYGTQSETPASGDNTSDESSSDQSKEFLVWRKPWITALGFFFSFYFLWFSLVIIQRYWVKEDFGKALPGLAKTAMRKFTIRLHMTFGGLAILCSPIQMVTPFTAAWKKRGTNWYRQIHRLSGRVYVACAVMSYFFGQWFIFLKEFVLAGGYNMGVAFSASGFAIFYFACMAWKTAPNKQNAESKYTVEDHRNYAIRSFSQIIAPVLYRYWYILVKVFKLYQTPPMYMSGGQMEDGQKLVCDDRDVCGDYERLFDAIHCWLYWISAWAVAEIVIVCLPKHQKPVRAPIPALGDRLEAPLLTTPEPTTEGNASSKSDSDSDSDNIDARSSVDDKRKSPVTPVVNFVGCLLAVLTIIVTGSFFYGIIISIVKKDA